MRHPRHTHARTVRTLGTAVLAAAVVATATLAAVATADPLRTPAQSARTSAPATAAATALATAPAGCYSSSGVSGFATTPGGAPLAHAPVMLHTETDPARTKVGQRVAARLIGWTRTDADGCYRIPITATKRLLASADRYGLVNFRLTLQRPTSIEAVIISRALSRTGARVALRPVDTGRTLPALRTARVRARTAVPGAIHQSFGRQADQLRGAAARASAETTPTIRVAGYTGVPSTPTGALSPDAARTIGGGTAARAAADAGAQPDAAPMKKPTSRPMLRSNSKLQKVFKKRPVLIGQWWSQMKGTVQTWQYTRGASSSLQSGYSLSGGPGTYSRSQTYAKSTEATVGFPTGRGKVGVLYRSYFRYAKYANYYCDPSVGCQLFSFRVKPYSWERGVNYVDHVAAPGVKKKNCSHYAKGGSDTSRGSKAITWTDGVLIGGDFKKMVGASLDLSSQTGFTSSAENRVTYQGRAGWLCGVYGPLSASPGILLARRF